jgi:hypothetical protein
MSKTGIFGIVGVLTAIILGWFFFAKSQNSAPTTTAASSNSESQVNTDILVAGTIEVDTKSLDMARQIPTVFVILRDQGSRAPYAVTKIPSKLEGNSLKFQLTKSDIMIQGQPTPAIPVLKVRFDSDGNPMTETPQDIIGTAEGFQIGSANVRVEAAMAQPQAAP